MIEVVYDSILIIINRLIKYAYFISYKEELIVENLVYAFNRNVIANHEILEEIISNRDKLFISKFWKSLINQLRIYQKLLIVYHPQTNK
jgi:hypothetical protein